MVCYDEISSVKILSNTRTSSIINNIYRATFFSVAKDALLFGVQFYKHSDELTSDNRKIFVPNIRLFEIIDNQQVQLGARLARLSIYKQQSQK